MTVAAEKPFSPGLEGIIAAETVLSLVDGQNGRLYYVGYPIEELAEHSTFEEVAFLLWHRRLPKAPELQALRAQLREEYELPDELVEVMRRFPADAHPMDALRTAVGYLGMLDPETPDNSPEANLRKAIRMTAKIPSIIATFHHLRRNEEPVAPNSELSIAGNFLYMLHGRTPSEEHARILDIALILHADHGMNASTFASMVTFSTLSDLYSAVVTGINTLKGPLHGGANERVMHMLQDEIQTLDRVESWLDEALAQKRKIMGFGHRVYKVYDPRARILKRFAEQLSRENNEMRWFEMGTRIEKLMIERYGKKGIWPNVDFYSGIVYHFLGIPRDLFTPIFAMSRVTGWTAHCIEYAEHNRIFRPLARYIGPKDLKYTPIDQR